MAFLGPSACTTTGTNDYAPLLTSLTAKDSDSYTTEETTTSPDREMCGTICFSTIRKKKDPGEYMS